MMISDAKCQFCNVKYLHVNLLTVHPKFRHCKEREKIKNTGLDIFLILWIMSFFNEKSIIHADFR